MPIATLLHLIIAPHALEALKTTLKPPASRVNPGLLLGQRLEATFLAVDTVGVQVIQDRRSTPLPMVPDLAYTVAWWSGHQHALQPDRNWRHRMWWVHLDGVSWDDLHPQPQEVRRILTVGAFPTGQDEPDAPELAALLLTTVVGDQLVARGFRIEGPETFEEVRVDFLGEDQRV